MSAIVIFSGIVHNWKFSFKIIPKGRRLWNHTWLRGGRWKVDFILRLLLLPCVKRLKHVHCVAFDNRVRRIVHRLLLICLSFPAHILSTKNGPANDLLPPSHSWLDFASNHFLIFLYQVVWLQQNLFIGHHALQLWVVHKWAGRWFTANMLAFKGLCWTLFAFPKSEVLKSLTLCRACRVSECLICPGPQFHTSQKGALLEFSLFSFYT